MRPRFQYAYYGSSITEVDETIIGHNGAVPGYQSVIGYDVRRCDDRRVDQYPVAPNLPLQQLFPADIIMNVIYSALLAWLAKLDLFGALV